MTRLTNDYWWRWYWWLYLSRISVVSIFYRGYVLALLQIMSLVLPSSGRWQHPVCNAVSELSGTSKAWSIHLVHCVGVCLVVQLTALLVSHENIKYQISMLGKPHKWLVLVSSLTSCIVLIVLILCSFTYYYYYYYNVFVSMHFCFVIAFQFCFVAQ